MHQIFVSNGSTEEDNGRYNLYQNEELNEFIFLICYHIISKYMKHGNYNKYDTVLK